MQEALNQNSRVWKYGNDIDTDVIIPARYLNRSEDSHLAAHCMEDLDPSFAAQVRPGDIVVAGKNFGCGSSREHAPQSIKAAGVQAVIAHSFARIFYRNALNIGLPILECPEAVSGIQAGDTVDIDLATGIIRNTTRGASFQAAPFPDFIQELIRLGGLAEYVREKMAARSL